jgi:hypothetical protein
MATRSYLIYSVVEVINGKPHVSSFETENAAKKHFVITIEEYFGNDHHVEDAVSAALKADEYTNGQGYAIFLVAHPLDKK